jgi:tetratricopeptide (TPR) repeat protein
MSALSSALTVLAQDRGGALIGADALPIAVRVPNAILAGGLYLWRAAWPAELAVFYPHPGASWSPWQVAAAAGALAALGAVAVRQRRERPFLLAGWLWYAITLVPVIGLVQVGQQATADRYTYVPLIGVFVAVAWSLPGARRPWAAGACSAVLLAAALAARAQVAVWRDSRSLFQHAADVVPDNWLAHKNLGVELFQAGDLPRALRSFEAALRLRAQDADLWADVGTCQLLLGRLDASVEALGRAVRLDPGDAEMWLNLGLANALLGRGQETAVALARLRELDPQRARLLESRLPELASRRQ